ncbi:MAG: AbrB/MazE/SpoVT family DNA-binding domain-containing protein [Firmicutes bacterium]|nr:AbrB/MazE/SpoVT family DNA-binding domain-containing protein [Bacillota bacterium]
MLIKIRKWGNSLALRLPMVLARELALHEGSEVNLSMQDGKLVIEPAKPVEYRLAEMLSLVSDDNLHGEYSHDRPVGREQL